MEKEKAYMQIAPGTVTLLQETNNVSVPNSGCSTLKHL